MTAVASVLTGGNSYEISQGFGVNLPDVPDWWYAYAADYGLNYGDHPGVDIGVPMDTPLYAIGDGEITQVGNAPYFRPRPVYQKLDTGETVIYGHMWDNAVKVGQRVTAGTFLGTSGRQTNANDPYNRDGDGSGPHVHLEIRNPAGDRVLDPLPYLDGTASIPTTGTTGESSGGSSSGGSASLVGVLVKLGIVVAGCVILFFGIQLAGLPGKE